ncbi:MAG: HEAT repeat domain-containing protein [Bacteroidales bacterium]|nr:HEAT repeat domain-containing protein [Bacteroidales bacterium]
MNKLLSYLIALCVIVCGIGGLAPTASAQDNQKPKKEDVMKLIKTAKGDTITLKEYKTVLLTFEKFDVDDRRLDFEWDCPLSSVNSQVKWDYKFPEGRDALVAELLTNESPKIRSVAITQIDVYTWRNNGYIKKLLDVLKDEKEPFVINTALNLFKMYFDDEEGIEQFVLSHVDDENPKIRETVSSVLTFDEDNKKVDGVVDAMRKLIYDPDVNVRNQALSDVSRLHDDSFVDDVEKILEDPVKYPYSQSSALGSLYSFWYDFPFFKHTNQKAYEICVKKLTKKPYTNDNQPDSYIVSKLYYRGNADSMEKWKKMATFYSDEQWAKYMIDIAIDANVNYYTRCSAVKTIATVGTKADLEKIKKTVSARPDTEKGKKDVLEEIDKQLEKLNK